jgi:DNA-binding CsgD family transcriptional regulator
MSHIRQRLVGKERECTVLTEELKNIRETFDAQKISPK